MIPVRPTSDKFWDNSKTRQRLGLAWPESLFHNVARKRTNGRSETALVPVPKRCTNTHPILRVSFGLSDRRITLRDLSTIRTVPRPVIWREQLWLLKNSDLGKCPK